MDAVGDGRGRGDHHLVGDLVGAGVEQPAEEAGEREHVVDLVGVVRAAGRDDRRVLAGRDRVDLGVGVGQREDDRVVRHRRDVVAGQQVRRGDADEDVGAGQHLLQRALHAGGVGVLGDPAAELVVRCDPSGRAPRRRSQPTMSRGALGGEQPDDRVAGGADAGDDDPHVLELLADHPQRVGQRGEHDDRGAVLVVVEDGDVEHVAQPALDLEAARRGDVLEVDAAVDRGDAP